MDRDQDGQVDREEWLLDARQALDAEGEVDKAVRQVVFRFSRDLYDYADVDGSGILDRKEVEYAAYLAQLAAQRAEHFGDEVTAYSFVDSQEAYDRLDLDANGVLSEDEFWTAAKKDMMTWGVGEESFEAPSTVRWMKEVLRKADADKNGKLDSLEELRHASFQVFDMTMEITAGVILRDLDANHDGRVEWQEVVEHTLSNPGRTSPARKTMRDVVLQGFEGADLNEDGMLDALELYRLSTTILATARAQRRG